jgi:hypothetical protein
VTPLAIAATIGAVVLLCSCGGGGRAETDSAGSADAGTKTGSHTTTARCSDVASSLSAVQTAVFDASPGDVVCVANGSYGKLSLTETKAAPGVTVQAQNPGRATIAGAALQGSDLTLARFRITDEVDLLPGSSGMTVDHNRLTGGYMGVNMPTSTTQVSDASITANKFVGPFGEDAIRANRYHDADGDGVGLLVAGNEFTNIRENGNHSDCLQSVWVGDHLVFRNNYLHDNRCQGFFVKDQASPVNGIVVDDNLFVRNNQPCGPPLGSCSEPLPAYFMLFGPYRGFRMTHNTIWQGDILAAFQDGTGADTQLTDNVVYRYWTSTDLSGITYRANTVCRREAAPPGGSWPAAVGETVDCSPAFADPADDDFRLGNGRGVDWAPADQHYGP